MKKIFTLLMVAICSMANAQFTKLLDFTYSGTTNGVYPNASFIYDGIYLYGTTTQGGTGSTSGTVFKIKPDGTSFTKLVAFTGTNGDLPSGNLYFDNTFLYGMTNGGGSNGKGCIFKVKPDGTGFAKLLDFDSGASTATGSAPYGSLISDGTYLYGQTYQGGTSNFGVIFKIKTDGTGFTKILDFAGTTTGANPRGSLFSDGTFLYGTTENGGTNSKGIVFKIKPDGTSFSKLIDFAGNATSGSMPRGTLISDGTYLYGTTTNGGANYSGTLFKIKTDGTGYSTLLDFSLTVSGGTPRGSLLLKGNYLYGMTSSGGASFQGVIFKIKPDGTSFIKLYDFASAASGMAPYGDLVSDGTSFYGMTSNGGANSAGTIFKYNDGTSGIEDKTADPAFTIYPNPSTTEINLKSELNEKIEFVSVVDISGKTVLKKGMSSDNKLNIEALNKGLYFINVEYQNQATQHCSFIKK